MNNYVMALEELENNLHPALQRRLFLFLRAIAIEKGVTFFITTHSHIVIDLFSNDPDAQIHHISKHGAETLCAPVTTYVQGSGILDDLDIRASDLLQANCILWVEGPSDRLFLNRWIELWTDGGLREGSHYQCVFYGGRLLAHLMAQTNPEETKDLINIILTNRHAAMLMDSDKKGNATPINATKARVQAEIQGAGGFSWITKGREIENYLPKQAIAALYGTTINSHPEQYESFASYLDNVKAGEGHTYLANKVLFAERVRPFLTKDDSTQRLDLSEKISSLVDLIHKWNKT